MTLPSDRMDIIRYSFEAENRRVLVTYHEQPTFEQWSQAMDRIFRDPGLGAQWDFLLDRSTLTLPATTPYIEKLVAYIDRKQAALGARRWAFVVSGLGPFGMGRMAEQLTAYPGCLRVFKDMNAAKEWLDEEFSGGSN